MCMAERGNGNPVLVAGGGVGGLAAALAIARAGGRVHVVERRADFTELGAGIQLAANATRVLARLGVLDAVGRVAVHPHRAVLLDIRTGRELTALRLGDTHRARYGHPYLLVPRRELLTALVRACRSEPGILLETGQEVIGFDPAPDCVEVQLADGTCLRRRALVSAEGLHSRLRSRLSGQLPRYSGMATYRGIRSTAELIRSSASTIAANGADPAEVRVWIGPNRHVVQYPIARGRLWSLAAVVGSPGADLDQRGDAAELDEAFAADCAPAREVVDQLDSGRRWPVFEHPSLPRWTQGRFTLLGDAAHAMPQYLAQGACQALEDAEALGTALGTPGTPTVAALRAYEAARAARATRCQQAAREWGRLWHSDDPLVLGLRNRVFAARSEDDCSEADWLYSDPAVPGPRSDTATPSIERQTA
jgi:3-hydroxybenzoate 6-monooxygenase